MEHSDRTPRLIARQHQCPALPQPATDITPFLLDLAAAARETATSTNPRVRTFGIAVLARSASYLADLAGGAQ